MRMRGKEMQDEQKIVNIPFNRDPATMDIEELVKLIADQIGDEREARKFASIIKNEGRGGRITRSAKVLIKTNQIITSTDLRRDIIRTSEDAMSMWSIESGVPARISHGERSEIVRIYASTTLEHGTVEIGKELAEDLRITPESEVQIEMETRSVDTHGRPATPPRKLTIPQSRSASNVATSEPSDPSHWEPSAAESKESDNEEPYVVEDGLRFWRRKRRNP